MYSDSCPMLPVWHEGQLILARWGNQNRSRRLPVGGWCWKEEVEQWGWLRPVQVFIPANLGREKGVWFQIKEGIEGILVYGPDRLPTVYMLIEKSTHYFNVMTRSERMPALVGERI
ncbi:hypothetical protein [Planctomicrobium sp. SH527]|uniref:hypothetical protein n=1 Tax=Planctomicrobium sp. SH527 TaxID=3448123 RepID=UPI003F5C6C1B